jgi:hypothetical protein
MGDISMAKNITCSVTAPMCDELAESLFDFLIQATAKREKLVVTGKIRKKATDETV